MISKANEITLQKDLTTDIVFYKLRDTIYCKEYAKRLAFHKMACRTCDSLRPMRSIAHEIRLAFLHDEISN